MVKDRFFHVEHWVFDLDNTLYPPQARLFDQIETLGTVWMGLTVQCCRCHDHKFDPLAQREYFGLFAFFNQTPINGGGGDPQMAPNMPAPASVVP